MWVSLSDKNLYWKASSKLARVFGGKEISYVSAGIFLKYLLPLRKYTVSLGKSWVGSAWWSTSRHGIGSGAAQWVVGYQVLPDLLCSKKEVNDKTGCFSSQ